MEGKEAIPPEPLYYYGSTSHCTSPQSRTPGEKVTIPSFEVHLTDSPSTVYMKKLHSQTKHIIQM